jgi:hypothetical protein
VFQPERDDRVFVELIFLTLLYERGCPESSSNNRMGSGLKLWNLIGRGTLHLCISQISQFQV